MDDIVKTWSQIKQNNAAIESVILKVSFHSFCLVLFVNQVPLTGNCKRERGVAGKPP